MSGLEEILEAQKNDFIRNIREISAPLNQLFNDKLFNYLKFAETNDTSYLVKETKKLRAQQLEAAAKEIVDPEKTTSSSSQLVKKNGPGRDSVDEMPAPSTGAIKKKKIKSEYPSAAPMTSTRSRTKHRRVIDEQTQTIKKSKLTSSIEQELNKTAQTDYEDAVSNIDPIEAPDSNTMVINSTVIVENPKLVKTTNDNEESESKKKILKTPPRTKSKKQQTKEIFSPFEKSSMKKKVEAFEEFGSSKEVFSGSKIPLYKESGSSSDPGSADFSNKFLPKTCSTFRNPEEMEAQLKKEALLQAQTEEKRRKREEKQMKALQQREMLQKEKEKQLEVQKIKEDKHKQMVAEKEEKLQKTKDEAEKKRLLAKQKAKMIAKEKERNDRSPEEAKMADTKPQGKTLPLYMTTRLPLLPTDDCYDSDDERYREKRYVKPDWCRDHNLTKQLYAQLISGEKVKNTLFGCNNRSPDLVEMFENIDPRKLKRTSSAQWKKPPRYTLFSMTSDILFSEDSEDDEKNN